MFQLKSSCSYPMTREFAKQINEMTSVRGERSLKRQRLKNLRREIRNGNAIAFRWAVAQYNGTKYRVNGQHTAHIFASNKMDIPAGTTVILEVYDCDSMDDVTRLWSQFDAPYSSRNRSENLENVFSTVPELQGLTVRITHLAASAVCFALVRHERTLSHHDKAELAVKEKDFLVWCNRVFPKPGPCYKLGILVAAFVTYRENPDRAEIFWSEVQNGTNTNVNSGSRVLERYCLAYQSGQPSPGRKAFNRDQWIEVAISAWRRWLTNRSVKSLTLSSSGYSRFVTFPLDS